MFEREKTGTASMREERTVETAVAVSAITGTSGITSRNLLTHLTCACYPCRPCTRGWIWILPADLLVHWSEVVTPFRDTVCLVHGEER
jgi:hypothetical protein